jgi:hypothetical protein
LLLNPSDEIATQIYYSCNERVKIVVLSIDLSTRIENCNLEKIIENFKFLWSRFIADVNDVVWPSSSWGLKTIRDSPGKFTRWSDLNMSRVVVFDSENKRSWVVCGVHMVWIYCTFSRNWFGGLEHGHSTETLPKTMRRRMLMLGIFQKLSQSWRLGLPLGTIEVIRGLDPFVLIWTNEYRYGFDFHEWYTWFHSTIT